MCQNAVLCGNGLINPLLHNPKFKGPLEKKLFEHIVGKEGNAGKQHFLLFPLFFPTYQRQILLYETKDRVEKNETCRNDHHQSMERILPNIGDSTCDLLHCSPVCYNLSYTDSTGLFQQSFQSPFPLDFCTRT